MQKRVLKLSTFILLAMILVLTISAPALAKPFGPKSDLYNAIDLGGARLLATQGDALSTIPYNWEWVEGSGNYGSPNLQGITATGLLAAYEKTRNRDYRAGAVNAGDNLKARYDAAQDNRPYAQDVEFLVRLFRDTHDWSYYMVAKEWYQVLMDQYTAEENVDRLITNRGSLAGWDAAAYIRAAYATGYRDYARETAKILIDRSAEWVHVPYPGTTDDYTNLSYGSMLWALGDMGFTFHFRATVNEYRETLIANQEEDGSWDEDYQTTAYVILGLEAVKGFGRDLRDAVSSAVEYLIEEQTGDGGWYYTGDGEYPEVDSECVMALESVGEQDFKPHGWYFPHIIHGHGHGQHGGHGPGH